MSDIICCQLPSNIFYHSSVGLGVCTCYLNYTSTKVRLSVLKLSIKGYITLHYNSASLSLLQKLDRSPKKYKIIVDTTFAAKITKEGKSEKRRGSKTCANIHNKARKFRPSNDPMHKTNTTM